MEEKKEDEVLRPSWEQSWSLQQTFDWFNDELFDSKLPGTMLTLSRNNNIVGGFFAPERWYNEDNKAVDEIAINANCLKQNGVVRAMSILCHEMVHLWQFHFGKPTRGGYHNQEWANKAKEIGLRPFGVDGKEVGQAIDTDLIKDGRAEKAIAEMPEEYTLPWMTEPTSDPGAGGGGDGKPGDDKKPEPPKKAGSRSKYTCPACGFNLWGKNGGHFECIDCHQMIVEVIGGQTGGDSE